MSPRVIRSFPEIAGVAIRENIYIRTGRFSGILLGGSISTNVIREPGRPTEYSVWGIHLATDDHLTFIAKANADPVVVRMVDCRIGSPTFHRYLEVTCHPNPSEHLVIPRGVAHLPTGVDGLLTLNTPEIFWDYRRVLVHRDLDVINVERDRSLDAFPAYRVCRYRVPAVLYPAALKAFMSRYDPNYEAPFVFDRNGQLYSLRRRSAS